MSSKPLYIQDLVAVNSGNYKRDVRPTFPSYI